MAALELGSAIGQSFRIWGRNFISFSTMALIAQSPLAMILIIWPSSSDFSYEAVRQFFLIIGVQFFLSCLLTGSLIHGVVQDLRGTRPTIGSCLRKSCSVLAPLCVVSILYALLLMAGFVLLIVPGFIVLALFVLAIPAVVVERKGPFDAFPRSADLTRGSRWVVLAICIVIFVIGQLIALPIGLFVSVSVTFFPEVIPGFVQVIVTQGFGALVAPLMPVTTAYMYHRLRLGKDGFDPDDLSRVFE